MPESNRSPLAERFRNRQMGRKPIQDKKRIKTSIFIDGDVMDRVNQTWKDYNHRHYPDEVIKALFFEELIECGLRRLEEVEEILVHAPRLTPSDSPISSTPILPPTPSTHSR